MREKRFNDRYDRSYRRPAEAIGQAPHPAAVGVQDRGRNVATAMGEAIDGCIADLADADA